MIFSVSPKPRSSLALNATSPAGAAAARQKFLSGAAGATDEPGFAGGSELGGRTGAKLGVQLKSETHVR
jgi:hypothetical protein